MQIGEVGFLRWQILGHVHAAGNDLKGGFDVDREEGLLELVPKE